MIKTISNKKYFCSLCEEERKGNIDKTKNAVCCRCLYKLMAYSQQFIKRQYDKAVKLGLEKKAELLKSWLSEEVDYGKIRRADNRRRFNRKIRPCRKRWKKQNHQRLDTQGVKAY